MEMERLLNAPDIESPEGLRDRAMLELLYAAGLRVSELISLLLNDVNMTGGVILFLEKAAKSVLFQLETLLQIGSSNILEMQDQSLARKIPASRFLSADEEKD